MFENRMDEHFDRVRAALRRDGSLEARHSLEWIEEEYADQKKTVRKAYIVVGVTVVFLLLQSFVLANFL